jgi:hypothetical protein
LNNAIILGTKFPKSVEEPADDVIEIINDSNDHSDETEIGDFFTAHELAALGATYSAIVHREFYLWHKV